MLPIIKQTVVNCCKTFRKLDSAVVWLLGQRSAYFPEIFIQLLSENGRVNMNTSP